MTQPDLEQAIAYATRRLSSDLAPYLVYHSLKHTRDEVVPAAVSLAHACNINGESLLLLQTAAWFHDIGYVLLPTNGSDGHEAFSAREAARVLPALGYQPRHISQICGMIMATRLPQTPLTVLEALLVDADLDVLGQPDFVRRNHDLRVELAHQGFVYSDELWYREQVVFLRQHRYFTAVARQHRDQQKQHNLEHILRQLAV